MLCMRLHFSGCENCVTLLDDGDELLFDDDVLTMTNECVGYICIETLCVTCGHMEQQQQQRVIPPNSVFILAPACPNAHRPLP